MCLEKGDFLFKIFEALLFTLGTHLKGGASENAGNLTNLPEAGCSSRGSQNGTNTGTITLHHLACRPALQGTHSPGDTKLAMGERSPQQDNGPSEPCEPVAKRSYIQNSQGSASRIELSTEPSIHTRSCRRVPRGTCRLVQVQTPNTWVFQSH